MFRARFFVILSLLRSLEDRLHLGKTQINLVFAQFALNFETDVSKLLSFGFSQIYLENHSLIRNFAARNLYI